VEVDVEVTAQASVLPHVDLLYLVFELSEPYVVLDMLAGVEVENLLQALQTNLFRGQLLLYITLLAKGLELLDW